MSDGVEILADEYGVSHVYAEDRQSLAFGQGYVQARDRLFQLDILRHVGYGDSASVAGPDQLPSDVQVRRDLYSRSTLEQLYERLPAKARRSLEGFAEGVNRAMVEMVRERDIPGEFVALGHLPEMWDPVDSAAIATYMLGYFGVFGGAEFENALRFTRLTESLGERAAWRAYRDLNRSLVPQEHDATLDREVDGGEPSPAYDEVPDEQLRYLRAAAGAVPWGVDAENAPELTGLRDAHGITADAGFGSNALAVSGQHTETGAPLLWGGPQMGYARPPVVHEIGLHRPGLDAVGISVVGIPSIVIGRTPEFAWTITSGHDDMVDTVAVDLHPDDRHRYEWDGEYHEMTTHAITHRPAAIPSLANRERPGQRLEQERAFLHVDGHIMPVVAWNPDERVAWAQRSSARGEELVGIEAMMSVPEADSVEQAAEAISVLPFSFNYLFADDEQIRYLHTARVPDRDPTVDWRFPVPGQSDLWEGTSHTVGDYGMDVTEPDRGYLFQWNNAPAVGWWAGDEEEMWGRIHRGDALASAADAAIEEPLSYEDAASLIEQVGRFDTIARHTAPRMVEVGRDSNDQQVGAMTDVLSEWVAAGYPWETDDGGHHAGMAIWEAVRSELQDELFEDTLGDLAPVLEFEPPRSVTPGEDRSVHAGDHGNTGHGDLLLARIFADEADHEWLDGDLNGALHRALRRAGEQLSGEFDSERPEEWQRAERTVKFDPMGLLPETDVPIVNRGTYNYVVSPAEQRAESVLPPANSGHLSVGALRAALDGEASPELSDQQPLFESFEYKPLPLDRAEIDVQDRTEIRPESASNPLSKLRALLGL